MESSVPGRLAGWEIHGFRTLEDLDVGSIFAEARTRWLRPNEIHAILCNHNCFSINMKPLKFPKSGTIVLFDRKMLRNFRKDGHNWKKKKDGKTVKEAHEHLKVGDEERIHVYYAHGEDSPTFVRRCYWLLDKKLENIVLVHYRETRELQTSLITPGNSNSSSNQSNPSGLSLLSEEHDSGVDCAYYAGDKGQTEHTDNATLEDHVMTLHEINTLEWEDLLATNEPAETVASEGADKIAYFEQHSKNAANGSKVDSCPFTASNMLAESPFGTDSVPMKNSVHFDFPDAVAGNTLDTLVKDGLQNQDSFGSLMNCLMIDSHESVDNALLEHPVSAGHGSFASPMIDHHQNVISGQIFGITDVSPVWAFSTEKTKVLVTGFFHGEQPRHSNHDLLCVCGDARVPVEIVQAGVFRCLLPPHAPGFVDLFLSFDGHRPITQKLTFEYRAPLARDLPISSEDESNMEEFQVRLRLAQLLFSTSKRLKMMSSKATQNALMEAHEFVHKTLHISNSWMYLIKSIEDGKISIPQVKDKLFELALKNRLQEWLLERIIIGGKITDVDDQGRGVIHLCAILGYTWAARLFSLSGISMDYRDKYGWTALHWAAYHGREKMVATLLSAGAKPNLVTDPTSENPGGCTAADLASKMGHEGLGAYLAEQALVEQFRDMTIAGNVSGSLQISTTDCVEPNNITEDEMYLKDTLAAYRTAADAAARIQTAFREHSLKVQTKAVESVNPKTEAQIIVAAMKIQHAFRNYETKKKIAAAGRIQYRFRTWKIRKEFLNMRRHAIKIQAVFRGYQERKQYRKILWSVGVLEKVILRWFLKRKGFRGLQVDPVGLADAVQGHEGDAEEDFFRVSRRQAEERVERSVVRVQAMFRSKKAQQDYRQMKLAHNQAKLELEGSLYPDFDIDA